MQQQLGRHGPLPRQPGERNLQQNFPIIINHQFLLLHFLQRVKSRKLKNSMFKRMSRSEERKSLLEAAPTREEERKEVDEEQKGCGCFTSWLVYIFIKIFD